MESITFGQCVKGAWRDGWRYLRYRPALAIALALYAWLSSFLVNALRPDTTPPFRLLAYAPLGVFALVNSAVFALFIMHAIRFVLLETGSTNTQPVSRLSYWRFFGCSWGFALIALVICCLAMAPYVGLSIGLMIWLARTSKTALDHPPVEARILIAVVGAAFGLIGGAISCFVLTRLSLLHTHVAIGGKLKIRDVWADTRGHFWSIWSTQFCAGLPVLAAWTAVAAYELAARRQGLASLSALNTFGTPTNILTAFGTLYLGAPCSAWLYRRYANAVKTGLAR